MTEMVNGEGQGSSNFASIPVNTPTTPTQSAPVEAERTFKQSEVNDLVGRAKSEAIERYKRDTSVASHNNYQPQQQQYAPQQNPQGNMQQPYQSGNDAQSEERIRRMAAEETQRLRNEWIQESHRNAEEQNAQRIASEFFTKLDAGKGKIENFDKVMADLDLRSIPYHVQLASTMDNTAEIMFELASNPTKIGSLQTLIDIDMRAGRQPKLAMAEMKRLSDSIKANQQASNFRSPNEPLSQLRPSNAGTDNNRALGVADYKRKYRV